MLDFWNMLVGTISSLLSPGTDLRNLKSIFCS